MFVLRDVTPDDFSALRKLATLLNSVNLPDDEDALRTVLEHSLAAFSGKTAPFDREYLIVMEDTDTGELIGTSMLFARHGTKEAPHIYLRVNTEEHYSSSIDRHFRHVTLRVGYDYDGPTEIGGLVLHPRVRGHDKKLGKQLSFIRFLFMGMKPDWFRDRVLAELLPPFTDDGKSALWEALGARFTGLDYRQADLISRTNKEFVRNLFPTGLIYTTLFDDEARAVIGKVGKDTEPVRRMLEKIGFRYTERVDPFDGGPHYEASVQELWPITHAAAATLATDTAKAIRERSGTSKEGLVARLDETGAAPGSIFRATWAEYRRDGATITVDDATKAALMAQDGDTVACLDFVDHTRR